MSEIVRHLGELLDGVCSCPQQFSNLPITRVTADSRDVGPGTLFVAVPGKSQNGEIFIQDAIKRGAVAILSVSSASAVSSVPILPVTDPRKALSRLASNFYGAPARALSVIGITGTNGKTTSCWLMHQALSALGKTSLRLGTAGNYLENVLDEQSALTTLDALTLHRYFALAVSNGATYATLEASSHALDQQRLNDVPFSIALFTNLTRDHLDYHSSFEHYESAKRSLFDLLTPSGTAVIHIDDPCGQRFADYCKFNHKKLITFGRAADATLKLIKISSDVAQGSQLSINFNNTAFTVHTPLIGEFNAENVLGVLGALLALGFGMRESMDALSMAKGAPGRLERFNFKERTVFVDYAHTPDALEKALLALRPHCTGKLSVIFGCGGDRDKGKRPLMGNVARRLAHTVILTSDNPRSENPESILSDIAAAWNDDVNDNKPLVESDRTKAILLAISSMKPGDILLVAGKGHEQYQILADRTISFSDQLVVKQSMEQNFS